MKVRVVRKLPSWLTSLLVAFIITATPLLGVVKDVVAATSREDAIQMQGRRRTFLVYAPEAGARNGGLPILMVLHGGLANGSFAAQQTSLADYVDRVGLLAVFPNAAGEQWNDSRDVTDKGLDDVAFLRGVMPWNGGEIASSPILGGAGGIVISALDPFNLWSTLDGCAQAEVSDLAGVQVKLHFAAKGQSGSQVALYQINGGGHGWPCGRDPQGPIARGIIGNVSNEISASALLIQFFKQYGL